MVMSIGWNPYFRNVKKSMVCVFTFICWDVELKCTHYSVVCILLFCIFSQETHILNEFGTDFYGSELRICITGYIRPEMDFRTLGKCAGSAFKKDHFLTNSVCLSACDKVTLTANAKGCHRPWLWAISLHYPVSQHSSPMVHVHAILPSCHSSRWPFPKNFFNEILNVFLVHPCCSPAHIIVSLH